MTEREPISVLGRVIGDARAIDDLDDLTFVAIDFIPKLALPIPLGDLVIDYGAGRFFKYGNETGDEIWSADIVDILFGIHNDERLSLVPYEDWKPRFMAAIGCLATDKAMITFADAAAGVSFSQFHDSFTPEEAATIALRHWGEE